LTNSIYSIHRRRYSVLFSSREDKLHIKSASALGSNDAAVVEGKENWLKILCVAYSWRARPLGRYAHVRTSCCSCLPSFSEARNMNRHTAVLSMSVTCDMQWEILECIAKGW